MEPEVHEDYRKASILNRKVSGAKGDHNGDLISVEVTEEHL